MSGRVIGKVALVTGAAMGMGRGIALRLAAEGADLIALDRNPSELATLVPEIRALGRRVMTYEADVRDRAAMVAAIDAGVASLGRLDIVAPNAGVVSGAAAVDITDEDWRFMIDVNLTGVWNTCSAAIPHLIAAGRGGAIVFTGSTASLKGFAHRAHYAAAKHGVTGLMKSLAIELGPHNIRVNSVNPTRVDTPMLRALLATNDPNNRSASDTSAHLLPVPWIQIADVANAVLFLVSDEARYITAVALPVDAGHTQK
jgi:SDR family mycofactocin-dependent oxidoreductase